MPKKYRIIKVETEITTRYKVQRREFIFWFTEMHMPFGIPSMEQPYLFMSIDEAKRYVELLKGHFIKESVVK